MADQEKDGVLFSKQAPSFSIELEKTFIFFQGFAKLWRNSLFTDFTLTCSGEEFKVHRSILYAHSLHLRRVFENELPEEGHIASLDLDTDSETLRLVLQFLYEGRLKNVLIEKVEKIAHLAEKLEIEELSTKCKRAQLENLSPLASNCLSAWGLAVNIQDEDLRKKFSEVALMNFVSLRNSSDFVALSFAVLKEYVCHPSLPIQVEEERLSAAVHWLRADPPTRANQFHELLRSLPLQDMNQGFLQYLHGDPIFQSSPECRAAIKAANENSWLKSHALEPCLVVMRDEMHCMSVYRTTFDKPVMRIAPPAAHENDDLGAAACCSKDHNIFVSGLDTKHDKVYHYDVIQASWTLISELRHGRKYHCMLAIGKSLFIIGGWDLEDEVLVREVEEVNIESGKTKEAGHIEGDDSYKTCCCLIDENDVAVMGPFYKSDNELEVDLENPLLQVYSSINHRITSSMLVPGEGIGGTAGIFKAAGSVIYVIGFDVYSCSVNDLYQQNSSVRLLNHYSLPDDDCTMVLRSDKQKVLLLGGNTDCSVYEADITDLLHDFGKGWLPVSVEWEKNLCTAPGAVCVAQLLLQNST